MALEQPPRNDLSVEFLSWMNVELRRRAQRALGAHDNRDRVEDEDERPKPPSLFNRLKGYFLCSLVLAGFVAAQVYFGI